MWIWGLWLAIAIGLFAWWEVRALRNDTPTLSRTVYMLSQAWPPFPFVIGLLIGGLAIHFWWGCSLCPRS